MIIRVAFYVTMILFGGILFFVDYEQIIQNSDEIVQSIIPSIVVLIVVGIGYELIMHANQKEFIRKLHSEIGEIPKLTNALLLKNLLSPESLPLILNNSLSKKIGDDEAADALLRRINFFLDDRVHHSSVEVEIELQANDQPGRYTLCVTETVPLPPYEKTFYIAVTDDRAAMSRLANYAGQIDKVYLLDAGLLPASVRSLSSTVGVQIKDLSLGVGMAPQPQLRKLSVPDKRTVLSDIDLTSDQMSRINVFKFLVNDGQNDAQIVYKFYSLENISDCYCFWIPDRTSNVKTVRIDFSGVADRIMDVKVIEFMCSKNLEITNSSSSYKVTVNDWIFPGHGIMLKWGKKDA